MTDPDHERRISALEHSRAEQWERINDMHGMVKVLYDRAERPVSLPCREHKAGIDKLDDRVRKLESTGNRFMGAWDFGKIAFGAALTIALWLLSKLPI